MVDARPGPLRRAVERVTGPLLHRALLRGLRPPRLHHEPSVDRLPRGKSVLLPLDLTGSRGQRLAAWLVLPLFATASRPAPVVLALHGWGANASTLWPVVDPLISAGFAVMLVDASCHGDSGDEEFMSLPRFAEDLGTALRGLRADPRIDAERVALLGHSVGAAAALLHGATRGGVRAIVSLAAFAHPREVMERWLAGHRLPRVLGAAILDHVQRVIGQHFDAIAPVELVHRVACPILFVHGDRDLTVPPGDAERLCRGCRQGELLRVDGDHDLRSALTPHAARIVDFLARHLHARGPCLRESGPPVRADHHEAR